MATEPIIHFDYNADHDPMTFGDTNGQPILSYRRPTQRELANLERLRSGRSNCGPFPEGWVLIYKGGHTAMAMSRTRVCPGRMAAAIPANGSTGISDLTAVDEAVASAQEHLRRMGYREQPG
jgi:hypothetical protein